MGYALHFIAQQMYPPTKVDFLHVSKKEAVEAAGFTIHFGAHHQRRARCPKHIVRFFAVVLTVIGFYAGKQSASAKWIAMAIEVAAHCARIFKQWLLAVVVLKQLGLAGAHFGMLLHIFIQRLHPASGRAHVAVEQHSVAIRQLSQRSVVALGKTEILLKMNHLHFRKLHRQQGEALVGAAVVGNNHVGNLAVGVSHHRWQIAAQQRGAIPIKYHYSHFVEFFHAEIVFCVSIFSIQLFNAIRSFLKGKFA